MHTGYKEATLPIEERWSARFFNLDKIFEPVNMVAANELKLSWYHNINSWENLCNFLGSEDSKRLDRPPKKVLGYHEWNPIGVNNEKE